MQQCIRYVANQSGGSQAYQQGRQRGGTQPYQQQLPPTTRTTQPYTPL
jgi:hypothetical protein